VRGYTERENDSICLSRDKSFQFTVGEPSRASHFRIDEYANDTGVTDEVDG
jgi:hypothetical protein